MASRTKKAVVPKPGVWTAIEVANMTPEQLLEIEDRHKREWPRLGWFEHGDSNMDVHRLIKVIRQLTGWQRPDTKSFEKRLGAVAKVAGVTRRKRP